MLPDFIPDMPIVGVQLFQLAGEGVGVGGRELGFAEAADGVEHVQRPAALGDGNVFQRFDATELRADFLHRRDAAFGDDGDAGFDRDAAQGDISANPADTTCRDGKRVTFDDGRRRKGEARNEQQIFDAPRRQIVVHEIKVRRLVIPNRVHHRLIRAVGHAVAEARLLAFELIPELAIRTGEIAGLGVVAQAIQFRRRTIRAIKIMLAPGFCDDTGALRAAVVSRRQCTGHGNFHWQFSYLTSTPARMANCARPIPFRYQIPILRAYFLARW